MSRIRFKRNECRLQVILNRVGPVRISLIDIVIRQAAPLPIHIPKMVCHCFLGDNLHGHIYRRVDFQAAAIERIFQIREFAQLFFHISEKMPRLLPHLFRAAAERILFNKRRVNAGKVFGIRDIALV